MEGTIGRGRLMTRFLLTLLYGGAGYFHLTNPDLFLPIVPDVVPWPRWVVLATGVAEIWGAIGLWLPGLRKPAGIGLALYALCVWPANVQHMLNDLGSGGGLPLGYHIPRLAFQPVLIWAALWAAHVIEWPWRKRDEA